MSYDKPIRRIAIVGTGVIGASWAAEYLARGFDVVATDPAPNAESNLRELIDEAVFHGPAQLAADPRAADDLAEPPYCATHTDRVAILEDVRRCQDQ